MGVRLPRRSPREDRLGAAAAAAAAPAPAIDGGVPTGERPGALSASATFRTAHEAHTRTPRTTTRTVCPPRKGYSNDAATIARTHTLLALSQADRYLADLPVDDTDLDTLEAVLSEPEFGVLEGGRVRELAPGLLGTLRRLASRVPPSAGFVPVVQSVMDDVRHDDHVPPDVACLRRWALAVQGLLEQAAARYEATARPP
ncbi:hypothetical protein [Actinacidiphila reveromycinica]|uniref:hypothetical protein n=1 Tax=Actinacidiphila reveromycinica TaxID=659352 RepID=UPI001F442B19|nr:hypothetical protein [Streptomyces sp. SN-593]